MRVNGFGAPLHPLQVISWVVFGGDVILFAIVGLPLLDNTIAHVMVSSIWGASIVILVVAAGKATRCNPADPHIRDGAACTDNIAQLVHCTHCCLYVRQQSKHCHECEKCIDVFDHHCKWLNNCIGRENYRAFATSISSVVVMTGIVLACCINLIVLYVVDSADLQKRLQRTYGSADKEVVLALLCLLVTVNLPLFVLDLHLVLLHTFLMSQQLTTYEYINHKRSLQESAWEVQKAGVSARPKVQKKVVTLPRCLDWIFFCGAKKRRKRRAENSREVIVTPVADTVEETVEVTPNGHTGVLRQKSRETALGGEDLCEVERLAARPLPEHQSVPVPANKAPDRANFTDTRQQKAIQPLAEEDFPAEL